VKNYENSWTPVKTIVDITIDPILILDGDLRVLTANDAYYKLFQSDKNTTVGKLLSELGNGEWNIPSLLKLLSDIPLNHSFFKGFEVTKEFSRIGQKSMILNARQIHPAEDFLVGSKPPVILLCLEDITEMKSIADLVISAASKRLRQ
jgi:two-component system, chemotaxis family, CheB/CheR fusion protein